MAEWIFSGLASHRISCSRLLVARHWVAGCWTGRLRPTQGHGLWETYAFQVADPHNHLSHVPKRPSIKGSPTSSVTGGNCRCTVKGESATLVSFLLFVSWAMKRDIFLWSTHAQCDVRSYHRTKVTRLKSPKMRTKSNLYLPLLRVNLSQVFCHNTGKLTQ